MKGKKTGGRVKGTPNKPNPLKEHLRAQSAAYYEPRIAIDDPKVADVLHVEIGTIVSRFDLDLAMMLPEDRAHIQERLLRYHTPQMQSVSADISHSATDASIAERLAQLAAENDGQ